HHLVRGGIALRDEPGGAVILVVLRLVAELAIPGEPEVQAPADTAAVLRLKHGIPARGQEGDPAGGVPAAEVAGPGATMRQDNGLAGGGALGPALAGGEQGRQAAAVAGFIIDKSGLLEIFGVD